MKDDEASSTAFSVLQGILLTAGSPTLGRAVTPEQRAACETMLRGSAEGRRRLAQLSHPVGRRMLKLLERVMVPGLPPTYCPRKSFIEDRVRRAIAGGARQVVGIGAGFDTLAFRLVPIHPDLAFIEIDHPATARIKAEALGARAPNLHLLAEDLSRRSIEEVLAECPAFSPDEPTVFVCEGVLMYLEEATVEGVFASVRRMTGPGTRFVFTAVAPVGSAENNANALLRLYLKRVGEPAGWELRAGDMAAFADRQGFSVDALAEDEDLVQDALGAPYRGALHRGEYCVAATAR